jgi:hypothetical protein
MAQVPFGDNSPTCEYVRFEIGRFLVEVLGSMLIMSSIVRIENNFPFSCKFIYVVFEYCGGSGNIHVSQAIFLVLL